MGEEPDPERMPPDASDFPLEVQVAFFMYNLLSDRFEGMSGTYLGKEWGPCESLFEWYKIEDKQETYTFMKLIEQVTVKHSAEQAAKQRKAEERKRANSGAGKTYTHNVRG